MAYVLDTSAVLAVFFQEPGYETVTGLLLDDSNEVFLAFITLMEFHYRVLRDAPAEEALAAIRLVEAWPVTIVESAPAWRRRAAEVKAGGGLSLADAWIAALALMHDAELVHKDPEFDRVAGLRAVKLTG
ncbi:MAG: PIN domain-containing protein [Dehalococcoidia bacterium]